MEHFIEAGNNRFVVGLEWLKITGTDPVLAARTQAKARKSSRGIVRSIDIGDDQMVHQVALCHMKTKGHVYSAAAHMANLYPSMIAIDHLENDLYWICVSDNGRILPGHDIAATDSEIKNIFNELASEYQLEFMTLVMPKQLAELIGVSDYIDESPFKLMGSNDPSVETRLKNLIGVPTSVYLAFVIGAVIAGGGAYVKHMDEKKESALQAMLAREALEEEERERQRQAGDAKEITDAELLQRARREEIMWLRDDFNSLNIMNALKHVYILSGTLPTRSAGWTIKTVGFSKDATKEIVSVWDRDGGSLRSLKQYFHDRAITAFSMTADSAMVSHSIEIGSQGIVDIIDYLDSNSISHQDVTDLLITRKFNFEIKVITETTRRETIQGLKEKTLESLPQLTVRKRSFTVMGGDKNQFVTLMETLQHVPNMIPESVAIDMKGGQFKWAFTGILYEL